jgi:hypothetical protein
VGVVGVGVVAVGVVTGGDGAGVVVVGGITGALVAVGVVGVGGTVGLAATTVVVGGGGVGESTVGSVCVCVRPGRVAGSLGGVVVATAFDGLTAAFTAGDLLAAVACTAGL